MTDRHRLPVRPLIRQGEDLAYFLTRCSEANGITLRDIAGHPLTAKIWEDPPPALLSQAAQLVGLPVPRLREATVRGQLPDAQLSRRKTGRRYLDHVPSCPECAITPALARLNVVVLCPTCGSLLGKESSPLPRECSIALAGIQRDVLDTLRAEKSSRQASLRLGRLEALMRAQEPALRMDYPDLVAGETPEWRESAAVLAREVSGRGGKGPRPPELNAALLVLCWPASADESDSRRRLVDCAIASDPAASPVPPPDLRIPIPHGRDAALSDLRDLVLGQGIKWWHVPNALRHRGDPRILEPRVLPHRSAQALFLTMVASSTHKSFFNEREVEVAQQTLGYHVGPAVREAVLLLADSPEALRNLTIHAQTLVDDGLIDLNTRRREFAQLRRLPQSATRSLPAAARANGDTSAFAAAWVWLDATQGRLSGGPHPYMSPFLVRQFDEDLNAEGRLVLRSWWQERLADAQFNDADVATGWAPASVARAV